MSLSTNFSSAKWNNTLTSSAGGAGVGGGGRLEKGGVGVRTRVTLGSSDGGLPWFQNQGAWGSAIPPA